MVKKNGKLILAGSFIGMGLIWLCTRPGMPTPEFIIHCIGAYIVGFGIAWMAILVNK